MTTQAITLTIKPTSNGQLQVDVVPTQFKEPEIVERPYTCMPGARRTGQRQNIFS
jgi:hypothetical protein